MTGLCLSCLLWVRPAPGGAAPRGLGAGGAERGWSRERAVDAIGMRGERDGAGASAPGLADWGQGELAGLERYQDRLRGNRDRAGTARDGQTSGWGWGDRTGSGAGRSPGDCGERSGTQPDREVAVGNRLGRGVHQEGTGLGCDQGRWACRRICGRAVGLGTVGG